MTVFSFDTFKLDTQLFQLSHAGEPIAIGAKPFDLLHYLIRHSGRIVSKRELLREVWNADAIGVSSIPTCISTIRHALGDPAHAPRFIETHRARGYRFIAPVIEDHHCSQSHRQSATPLPDPPFVGRESEMDALATAFARTLRGQPQIFLVIGDAGIGKTRLLEEFAHTAEQLGAEVLVGRCREDDGAPGYWPWIQILRSHFELDSPNKRSRFDFDAGIIYQLLPELGRRFPQLREPSHVEPERARFRLFDGVSRIIQAAARDKPLVLLIDDLHRADPSSVLLLQFLVSDLRSTRVFLVATCRDCDLSSGDGATDPLSRIACATIARSLRIRGLCRSDVAKLLGQPEQSEIVPILHAQSGGNPLFLTYLVHLYETDRALPPASAAPARAAALPVGIRDIISSQLGALSRQALIPITAAAVIGRDFDLPLLAQTLSLPTSNIVEALETAVSARVIESVGDSFGSFRFSHALVRDVAYSKIPRLQRARLHRQIGEALERIYSTDLDDHVEQLAFHFSQAAELGNPTKAITYAVRAGERAAARLAHDNAPEHFRHALDLLTYCEQPNPRIRCQLLIQLGAALIRTGERDAARLHLLHAANIARGIGAPTLIAHAALALAPGFFTIEVGTSDRELAALLIEAQRLVPSSEAEIHVRLNARLALESVWSNSPSACDVYSKEALRLAAGLTDPATRAYALSARHATLWGPENLDLRRKLIAEIESLCHQVDDAEIAFMHRVLKITILLEIGLINDVEAEIRSYAKLSRDLQLPHARWYVSLFEAMRYLLQGRFADATAAADRFLALGNRVGDRNAPQSFAAHLIFRHWEANTIDRVFPALDQILSNFPSIVAWQCAKAFCLSELQRPETRDLLHCLSEGQFARIPKNETWGIAITMLAIAAVNMHDRDRISELYRLLLPGQMCYTVIGYGVLSFGSRARDLGNLAAAMEEFETADEHYRIAISQNEKLHSPPWVARTQYDYASMLATRRDAKYRNSIRELACRAHESADRLGMARLKFQIADLLRNF